jgi:hypothetical protein
MPSTANYKRHWNPTTYLAQIARTCTYHVKPSHINHPFKSTSSSSTYSHNLLTITWTFNNTQSLILFLLNRHLQYQPWILRESTSTWNLGRTLVRYYLSNFHKHPIDLLTATPWTWTWKTYTIVLQEMFQHNQSDPRYLRRYIFLHKILFPSRHKIEPNRRDPQNQQGDWHHSWRLCGIRRLKGVSGDFDWIGYTTWICGQLTTSVERV